MATSNNIKAAAVYLYRYENMTMRQIGKKLNVGMGTIHRWVESSSHIDKIRDSDLFDYLLYKIENKIDWFGEDYEQ